MSSEPSGVPIVDTGDTADRAINRLLDAAGFLARIDSDADDAFAATGAWQQAIASVDVRATDRGGHRFCDALAARADTA